MPHEIIVKDGICYYRDIVFEQHNDRFMVISNSDLLDLGLCTPKTIQMGHRGYSSLCTECGAYERAEVAELFGGLCAACGYDGIDGE